MSDLVAVMAKWTAFDDGGKLVETTRVEYYLSPLVDTPELREYIKTVLLPKHMKALPVRRPLPSWQQGPDLPPFNRFERPRWQRIDGKWVSQ